MGYVDPLGRFIRDPDVDTPDGISSHRRAASNPLQFLSNLVRNEQDDLVRPPPSLPSHLLSLSPFQATDEAAARFAETFINEITSMTANLDNS